MFGGYSLMLRRHRLQSGLSLLEVMVSLGIIATVTAGLVQWTNQQSDDTRAAVTALHMKTVGMAANEYIKNNFATITSLATDTQPVLIRVSDLIAGGALNSGFSATNARGQNVCVLVLEPTAGVAMVVAEGGDTIDDLTLGQIAATVGAAGGGIYSTSTTNFRGAMGGWTTTVSPFSNANHLTQKCDGSAGNITFAAGRPAMAVWFADNDTVSATLYRDAIPGNTALNTMNTPILMGAGTVQTVGSACTSTGAIGRDTTGQVVSCQSGTWRSQGSIFWRDPVANFTSLPTTDPTGAVRMTTDTSRAFMWTGGAWTALAVDQNGNLTVPGTLTAAGGRVVAWNDVTQGGVLQLQGANGTNIYLQSQNGKFRLMNNPFTSENVVANGRLTAGEYVQINGTATEGAACTPNGLVGRTTAGLLLSCQSGVWQKGSGTATTIDETTGLTLNFCFVAYSYYEGYSEGSSTITLLDIVSFKRIGAAVYAKSSKSTWESVPGWFSTISYYADQVSTNRFDVYTGEGRFRCSVVVP